MVDILQRNKDRLFLQKEGANDVFIDNSQLIKQHQIDGLRFLYLQFKKKKPGAIVNFPTDCGKSVTVVLFLFAVRELLKKPILILCREDEVVIWKEHFLKWTEFTEDDITIDALKPVKNKKIFITTADCTTFYQQHSWSIIAVKEDNINKNLYRITNSDFKIFVTSTDVKKDLPFLAFIYEWMHPKLKLNIKDFIPSQDKRDMYAKCIYLDTFLEDFATREDKVRPFNSSKEPITSEAVIFENNVQTPKKSRKNKDATGTKVKRSKKNIDKEEATNKTITTYTNTKDLVFIDKNDHNETIIKDFEGFDNTNLNENKDFEHDLSEDVVNEIVKKDNELINDITMNNDEVENENVQKNADLEQISSKESNKINKCLLVDSTNDKTVLEQNLSNDESKPMEIDSTEPISFGNAINDIIKNKNILHLEKSMNTDKMDTDNSEDKVKNLDNSGFIENKEEILDNSKNFANETVNNDSFDGKDDLTNLEETVLKKFKGSFLDTLF